MAVVSIRMETDEDRRRRAAAAQSAQVPQTKPQTQTQAQTRTTRPGVSQGTFSIGSPSSSNTSVRQDTDFRTVRPDVTTASGMEAYIWNNYSGKERDDYYTKLDAAYSDPLRSTMTSTEAHPTTRSTTISVGMVSTCLR